MPGMSRDTDGNKLDFVDGVSFMPWDWRNLGAAFQDGRSENNQSVAARCNFTVRRGFDSLDSVDYGRVVEGVGDLGINLRSKQFVFHLGASNLTYKSGTDAPLRAVSAAGGGLASLKLTVAQEYTEDQYYAISYDVLQKKPELSLAWSGQTFTERATMSLHLDPVDRCCLVRAGVSFPGPEWREDVYNDVTGKVECPRDDGARHAVWVEHEARRRRPMAATRVGARVDVGRVVNWLCDAIDYRIEPRLPGIIWKIPLSQRLYNFLIPAEDENQDRHRIKGLSLEVSHDFARSAPAVGISKRLGWIGRAAVTYDVQAKEAEAQLRVGGIVAGVAVARAEGAGWREWSSPCLTLSVQPLAFL